MKELHLILKAQWYKMIESGVKKEEYRDLKPYWMKRLFRVIDEECSSYENIDSECAEFYCAPENISIFKKDLTDITFERKYDYVTFHYGYTSRSMTFRIKDIRVWKGKSEWGAEAGKQYFVIRLGERVYVKVGDGIYARAKRTEELCPPVSFNDFIKNL